MSEKISARESHILSKCNFFVDVHLWPLNTEINPKEWLKNFKEEEKELALILLDSFMYYSKDIIEQVFRFTLHNLSNYIVQNCDTYNQALLKWQNFYHSIIVTHVPGERPNESDSGYTYTRKARQIWGIKENKILDLKNTLKSIYSNNSTVIFVDDFIGSGQQFSTLWYRREKINGLYLSLDELYKNGKREFYYCPLISTSYGLDEIKKQCGFENIFPTHILNEEYSTTSIKSKIWPEGDFDKAQDFIKNASLRAGIPIDEIGGFHNLGLTIAFMDSVPDATLPIYYWEKNGWIPLVRKK